MQNWFKLEANPIRITSWFIVLFWTIWSVLVVASNCVNWLQVIGALPQDAYYTSHNYDLIVQALAPFTQNSTILLTVFGLDILSYFLTIYLLLRAFYFFKEETRFIRYAAWGLLVGIFCESGFVLIDEITLQYGFEHGHMDRLALRLISLGLFFLLNHIGTDSKKS